MDVEVSTWLAEIGRRGGKKSRRTLAPDVARAMVKVREARRAYRRFHTACFWSFDPDYVVRIEDVDWIADQLQKHGGRSAWLLASRLSR